MVGYQRGGKDGLRDLNSKGGKTKIDVKHCKESSVNTAICGNKHSLSQ